MEWIAQHATQLILPSDIHVWTLDLLYKLGIAYATPERIVSFLPLPLHESPDLLNAVYVMAEPTMTVKHVQ